MIDYYIVQHGKTVALATYPDEAVQVAVRMDSSLKDAVLDPSSGVIFAKGRPTGWQILQEVRTR
ncbi:hypothetical protein ACFY7C_19255 [Streptomyces sp. NPDC012769]|uniref:hypothetical protein n=1 Tax=Streptomyces sp. NPDC012769 TaxID=3364848 RepID=UPI0036A5144D